MFKKLKTTDEFNEILFFQNKIRIPDLLNIIYYRKLENSIELHSFKASVVSQISFLVNKCNTKQTPIYKLFIYSLFSYQVGENVVKQLAWGQRGNFVCQMGGHLVKEGLMSV